AEVRRAEDGRDGTPVSDDRVVRGRHDGQRGRRRRPGIRCGRSRNEDHAHRRPDEGKGSRVHGRVSCGYNSSFGGSGVRTSAFRRRRIRMIKTKTSRKSTPPLRTRGKVADVDAVTWNVIEADTSGLSGVSSLFASRIVGAWAPSGDAPEKGVAQW